MNSFRCLNLEHENMELGNYLMPYCCIHSRRKSQWWPPDGKELSNPAESLECFWENEQAAEMERLPGRHTGSRSWRKQASWRTSGNSLSYSGNQHGVTTQNGKSGKMNPFQHRKNGSERVKGLESTGIFIPTLIWFLRKISIIRPHAWSLIPFKPGTTEEPWIQRKGQFCDQQFPFRWERNWSPCEPILTHTQLGWERARFSLLEETQKRALSQTCADVCQWSLSQDHASPLTELCQNRHEQGWKESCIKRSKQASSLS